MILRCPVISKTNKDGSRLIIHKYSNTIPVVNNIFLTDKIDTFVYCLKKTTKANCVIKIRSVN